MHGGYAKQWDQAFFIMGGNMKLKKYNIGTKNTKQIGLHIFYLQWSPTVNKKIQKYFFFGNILFFLINHL